MIEEHTVVQRFEWARWIAEYGSDPPSVLGAAKAARQRGSITKQELIRIAYWKSPRAAPGIAGRLQSRAPDDVICPLPAAAQDAELVAALSQQYGVSTAIASAVLGLVYPDRFAVTDWRARQELREFDNGYADKDTQTNYLEEYIRRVRKIAESQSLTPREVEKALWARSRERYIRRLIKGLGDEHQS